MTNEDIVQRLMIELSAVAHMDIPTTKVWLDGEMFTAIATCFIQVHGGSKWNKNPTQEQINYVNEKKKLKEELIQCFATAEKIKLDEEALNKIEAKIRQCDNFINFHNNFYAKINN